MGAIDDVSKYIQQYFSRDGIEVLSQGPRSLTIELPAECHDVGALCAGVEQGWEARVDLVAPVAVGLGSRATVWLPQGGSRRAADIIPPAEPSPRNAAVATSSSGMWCELARLAALSTLLAVALKPTLVFIVHYCPGLRPYLSALI